MQSFLSLQAEQAKNLLPSSLPWLTFTKRSAGPAGQTPLHLDTRDTFLTSLTPPGTAVTQSRSPEPLVGTQGPMLTVWAAGGAGHRAEQGQGRSRCRSRCRRLVPTAPCSRPAAGRHLPAAFPAAPRRAGPPEQILLLITKI